MDGLKVICKNEDDVPGGHEPVLSEKNADAAKNSDKEPDIFIPIPGFKLRLNEIFQSQPELIVKKVSGLI